MYRGEGKIWAMLKTKGIFFWEVLPYYPLVSLTIKPCNGSAQRVPLFIKRPPLIVSHPNKLPKSVSLILSCRGVWTQHDGGCNKEEGENNSSEQLLWNPLTTLRLLQKMGEMEVEWISQVKKSIHTGTLVCLTSLVAHLLSRQEFLSLSWCKWHRPPC